eukprot:gene6554-15992_t
MKWAADLKDYDVDYNSDPHPAQRVELLLTTLIDATFATGAEGGEGEGAEADEPGPFFAFGPQAGSRPP